MEDLSSRARARGDYTCDVTGARGGVTDVLRFRIIRRGLRRGWGDGSPFLTDRREACVLAAVLAERVDGPVPGVAADGGVYSESGVTHVGVDVAGDGPAEAVGVLERAGSGCDSVHSWVPRGGGPGDGRLDPFLDYVEEELCD